MNTQRAAMQMALEFLEFVDSRYMRLGSKGVDVVVALREALAQPQGEWVDLTPHEVTEQIREGAADGGWQGFAQRITAKFKEKNTLPVVPQGEPVAWMYHDGATPDQVPDVCMGTVVLSLSRIGHYRNERPLYTTPPSVEAAIEREKQLFETFARIADYLCIDAEAARRAEGKPSDVFIAAIEAAIEATKEKAAKVCEELVLTQVCDTKSVCAAAIRARGEK